MNMDLFLGEKRWEILKVVSENPSSPIEIAEKLQTTVSYISQQLKLIEVAGLVVKTKTGYVLAGKPRNLYSLQNELVHLSILGKGMSEKKTINLTPYHRAIVNIWRVDDLSSHEYIEKIFWKLDSYSDKIDSIFLEGRDSTKIFVVSEDKEVKQKIESYIKKMERQISCSFISQNNISKSFTESAIILQDNRGTLGELIKQEI